MDGDIPQRGQAPEAHGDVRSSSAFALTAAHRPTPSSEADDGAVATVGAIGGGSGRARLRRMLVSIS